MKTGYYQADKINGVTYVGELLNSDSDPNVYIPVLFYNLLSDLGQEEIIFTYIGEYDSVIFDIIRREYGIN